MAMTAPAWSAALTFIAGIALAGCGSTVVGGSNPTSTGSGAGGAGTTTTGSGGSAHCVTAADCPGTDTTCATRTCTAEVCGVELAPLGFLAGQQTSGDCQQVVCDGNGATIAVADDSDVPSDGNACTVDVCTNGAPTHVPAPAGTACGPGGQLACDGAGTCVGCAADAECGTSTACAAYTCDTLSGLCAVTYVPSGQGDPGGQTTGDCKRIVCNGSGGTVSVADDTDVPDDGNPCTIDGCSMGQPTHVPTSVGTACGNGFKCDGKGTCQSCLADADCGAATACAAPTCANGACVTIYVPSGQGDLGGQTAGDCQKIVCDGSGGTLSVADDTDVPDDGNPCTADACSGGVASHTLLPAGTTCGVDLVCDGAGSCVGCVTDADCGTSTVCATHQCQMGACVTEDTPLGMGDPGGQVAGDCKRVVCDGAGGTTTVPDDGDVQDDGNPCTTDTCSGGAVQHLPVSCGAGLVCAGASCVSGCVIGGAFYAPDTVNPGNACQVCNPAAATSGWSSRPDNTTCDDDNPCTKGDHCQSGVCGGTAYSCTPTSCQESSVCDGNGGCIVANKPTGTLCPDGGGFLPPDSAPGPGVCSATGFCLYACFVDGKLYPPQDFFLDTQICLNCDPKTSRTSLYTGGCHVFGIWGGCSGTGVCNLMVESCDCADCNTVQPCGGGYCTGLPKPSGTSCWDDGDPCTSDICNGLSSCFHPPAPNGTSCGNGLVCSSGSCVAGP